MLKNLLFSFLLVLGGNLMAQNYSLKSPDDKLAAEINVGTNVSFSVLLDGNTLIDKATLSMSLKNGKALGLDGEVKKVSKRVANEVIRPIVPIKNSSIVDNYNELTLHFKGGYDVTFRAYDDAVTYRFETSFRNDIIVEDEQFDIELSEDTSAWFPFLDNEDTVENRWMTEYQTMYSHEKLVDTEPSRTIELPLLLRFDNQDSKILITESNLWDYPSLYLERSGNKTALNSIFPPRVQREKENAKGKKGWDRTIHPESVYDYIAETKGERTFPWRIIAISKEDKDLLNNEIVYKLAEPNQLTDTEWIKPGQVAWDWWNDWNITGVSFEAGINNETYKYYIDFASENKIPYIIMDDGWYELGDLTREAKDIDVAKLVEYGKTKNVGIILWASWKTLRDQMQEALDLFEKWGIEGIKVDFMRRDDQDMVNFYAKAAKEAAKRHLLVDFHGSYKPVGLERTFPNIVSYESVMGLEQNKWSDDKATPEMAVTLPFIRMFVGPMDYTPGAMRNAQKNDFQISNNSPMSMGTRSQQVAMYVIYESPLQMLSDNPTAYENNQETLDYLTIIPTTWDKTIPLDGKIGEYVVMARQKGNTYFIGAMTNWDERDIDIDLSFLPEGEWEIEIFKDGINADRNATDYKIETKRIQNTDGLRAHLAKGGGWVAQIKVVN